MTDFASIGIEVDSRPVVEGTKALDALGEASTRVEQKVRASNAGMSDTAKIMQMQAEQAKAAAQANSVLGNSTSALTVGQVQLIERFKEQAATVGMCRSQLMAYQAAQLGVTEQTKDAIAAIKAHEDALKAKKEADDAARNSTSLLSDAIKMLAAAYAALKIADYIKDSALMAARYETLGVVMGVVGKTAGYTAVQMETASQAIAAQGITMITARESAVKLVQAHVDLTNASKLARIAQDAAVIGNINSSDAFDRLVNGVSRGNVLILRNIGINVSLKSAYDEMAASLGKHANQLTENERVQARLNAVMERGQDIAGTYEAAMGTAGKQILSMQRYVDDLKTTFGETFNEVLTVAVMSLTSGLKDANGEVSELAKNGQLQQWGHDLAAVMIGVVNSINNVIVMTKLAAVEAAHATGKDGGAGLGYAAPGANPLARMGAGLFAAMGASTAAPTATSEQTYQAEVARISAGLNQFQREFDNFEAKRLEKQKADAAARLKVDQDYAAAATAILMKAGNDATKLEAARQQVNALYQKTYVGTPTFRDTDPPEKPKVDQVANTELQDHLARIKDQEAADKAYADYVMQLADMRRKAGELGDEEYFKSQKDHLKDVYLAEQQMYADELVALRAHHNATNEERAKNAKAIDDVLGKQSASRTTYSHQDALLDEGERLRQKAVEMASQDASNKYISGLNAEAQKLEMANGAREQSRSAIERENVARLDAAILLQQQLVAQQSANGASEKEVDQGKVVLKYLQDVRDARARIATAAATQESDLYNRKMAEQAIQDWQRAGASIADSLRNAFGAGGQAIGDMFKAYADGQAGQLRAAKDLAYAKDRMPKDSPEQIAAINRAQLNGTQAQLKSYGDMAQAAQGFFDQGSRGYKALQTASQVMHAAELAMNLASIAPAMAAGAAQFFAQSGWGGFAGVAAMAAVIAGFGVAVSGGSSGPSAAQRQASQGTGTILGDSNAKSDSISKSIELTAANSSTQINYLSGMLTSLQAIQTNIGSFASLIVQNGSLSDPKVSGLRTVNYGSGNLGAALSSAGGAMIGYAAGAGLTAFTAAGAIGGPIGMVVGAVIGAIVSKLGIFGGKQTVTDSGFTLDKTSLASVLSGGVNAKSYADITTSGGWFSSDKTSVQTAALSADVNRQFTEIIKSLADSVKVAGGLLGENSDDFAAKLNSFVVDIGNVSLKGLSGDDQQKALEAVFSKLGDQMAQWVVGGLEPFEKVGEGYLQTLTRVATDYAKLDASLQSIGETFGAVGIGSVAARENLIGLAGGIDKFQSQTADFAQNFLTKAQQLAPVQAFVAQQLGAINLGWIKTREDFAKEIASLSGRLDDAGVQQTYAALMSLESVFASVTPEIVDATKSLQEIADERKTLQDKLDALTMTSIQLHDKERATIDANNLALYDRVSALQAEKDASQSLLGDVDSMFAVLQNTTKVTTDAISARITAEKALSDAIKSTLSGMKATSNDLTDRAAAQAQIKAALAIAKAGGPLPTADSLKDALSTVSQDASTKFGSYADYLKDLYSTKNDLSQLGDLADSLLSVDQKQLDSLNAMLVADQQQIDLLKGISTSLTIQQAQAGFQSAVSVAQANPVVSAHSSIVGLYQSLLGRAPDAAGLAFWEQAAAGGESIDAIRGDFLKSAEYKSLHPFAIGTNFVPQTMPALVHEGERIIPAADNRALMARLSSPSSNNDALLAELKSLRQEVATLRQNNSAENVAQVKQLQATVDLLTRVIYGGDTIKTEAVTS